MEGKEAIGGIPLEGMDASLRGKLGEISSFYPERFLRHSVLASKFYLRAGQMAQWGKVFTTKA